jgi:hypothetical protein
MGGIIIFASSYYSLNKTHIGFAFALPPIIYYALKKHIKTPVKTDIEIQKSYKRLFILFIILFLFIISLSLLFWQSEIYHRPIIFFIFIAIAYVVITGQIFFNCTRRNVPIILLEIIIVAIIVRGSIYYLFPTVYGNDPFFHTDFIQKTISSGSITMTSGDYSNFPMSHLLVTFISKFTGLNIKNSYFAISLIEVFASLFVFLIGKALGGNRLGLLSAMLITIAPYNIFWGFWIIPMTLGMVFLIIIFYLLLKRNSNSTITTSILLIFFCLSIIMVHTVASFVTWVILLIILLGLIVYRFLFPKMQPRKLVVQSFNNFLFSPLQYKRFRFSINIVSLMGISLFSYWMFTNHYTGVDFFSLFTKSLISSLVRMDTASVSMVSLAPTLKYQSIFLLDLPSTLLMFFCILGSLYLIDHKFNSVKFVLIFTVIVLLTIIYGGALFGTTAILPHRWFVFMEVLMVIVGAYGIYLIVFTQQTFIRQLLVCSIIIFVIAFSAVTTPLTNTESPFYAKELGTRSGFFHSEVAAAENIESYYDGNITRNSKYALLDGINLNPNDLETYEDKMMVIRSSDLEKGFIIPLFGAKGKLLEILIPNSTFSSYLDSPKCDNVYDNGEVKGYISRI